MAPRVLVVDDEAQTVQLLQIALEGEGYEVETASNGAECLLAIDRCRPDLVILDVGMPILDGYHVLRSLREQPGTEDLPVIMLTARSADEDVRISVDYDAIPHITKPFEMAELLAHTRRVLAPDESGL